MCQLDRKNVTYLLEYDIIKIIKIGWCQYKMKNKFAELDIGLISFVSNIKEYQRNGELKKYLETGNQKKDEWNLAEEVVRLLTLASTESFQTSPTECLIINLENNKLSNIYDKILDEMEKGFNKIIVSDEEAKEKMIIITKFLCIEPFVTIELA